MKMQRRFAVFAALSLTGAVAVAAVPAQAAAPKPAQTQIVLTSSYNPIPAHRTLDQVKADPSATSYDQATGATTSLATGQAVQPNTGTPSGYTLVEQSKSDYIYMSKPYYMDVEFCNPSTGCAQQAEIYTQVKQNVVGGSSKNWILTQLASTIALENPAITWFYTWTYYCGINVSGGADHICENGAAPSGVETGFNPGDSATKRFETINSGKDFPMVAIVVHWSTGGTGTGKFREWDTCNSASSTKLCSSTGTGS